MVENTYYLDTSIWLDYYLEREENGKNALKLILKIINDKSVIIFSNFVKVELKHIGLSKTEINSLLQIIKPDHIRRVQVTNNQIQESKKLAQLRGVPLGDAIHAILARDHEAQFVSRDKDFERLKDITLTKKPEDLLFLSEVNT